MTPKRDFGGYELGEQLGKGGMARVYLGLQKNLDKPVAIKILYANLADDARFVERFEREARVVAKMRHENIGQVFDYGRIEDEPYIVMEYVQGSNLRDWLDKYGTPPIEVGLLMLRDVGRGLDHAHRHDVVHRDLKPSNIMFSQDGVVKLMDFGLARIERDDLTFTVSGQVLGSYPYMSPEQAIGERVDKASDIFSLGIVCYEVLGGQRPFKGETASAVTQAITSSFVPPRVETLNPLVPERIAKVLAGMLEKDRSKRIRDVAHVLREFEEAVWDMGVVRDRSLLAEYAQAPESVAGRLRKDCLDKQINLALTHERMGHAGIDDALHAFRCALFVDPQNVIATKGLKKLERERREISSDAETVGSLTVAESNVAPPPWPRPVVEPLPASPPVPPTPPVPWGRHLAAALGGVLLLWVIANNVGAERRLFEYAVTLFRHKAPVVDKAPVVAKAPDAAVPSTKTLPVPTQPDAETKPPAPPVSPPLTTPTVLARLVITTEPSQSMVRLDHGPAHRAPATFANLALWSKHAIEVSKSGYDSRDLPIVLGQSDTTVAVSLAPSAAPPVVTGGGSLQIYALPWAAISVDGKLKSPHAQSEQIDLPVGTHDVEFDNPDYKPKTAKVWHAVHVEAGKIAKLYWDFDTPGTLVVLSADTRWGFVSVDGKTVSREGGGQSVASPARLTLKPGNYQVTLSTDKLTAKEGTVQAEVVAGKTTELVFTLLQR